MFILLKFSVFNRKIAQTLAAEEGSTFFPDILLANFDHCKNEEKLTLINLDTTDFDSILPAELVANQLVQQGLPMGIKIIDLLVPDICNYLPQFAGELAFYLKIKHNRAITVRSIYQSPYDYIFIIPPISNMILLYFSRHIEQRVRELTQRRDVLCQRNLIRNLS